MGLLYVKISKKSSVFVTKIAPSHSIYFSPSFQFLLNKIRPLRYILHCTIGSLVFIID